MVNETVGFVEEKTHSITVKSIDKKCIDVNKEFFDAILMNIIVKTL